MKIRIRSASDVLSGILFAAIGAVGVGATRALEVGSAARMGPGYMPLMVGGVLIALGAAIAIRGLAVTDEPLPRVSFTPVFVVAAAMAAFVALVDTMGFPVASVALIGLSALGTRQTGIREGLLLAIGLTVGTFILFGELLGMPLKIWPG